MFPCQQLREDFMKIMDQRIYYTMQTPGVPQKHKVKVADHTSNRKTASEVANINLWNGNRNVRIKQKEDLMTRANTTSPDKHGAGTSNSQHVIIQWDNNSEHMETKELVRLERWKIHRSNVLGEQGRYNCWRLWIQGFRPSLVAEDEFAWVCVYCTCITFETLGTAC